MSTDISEAIRSLDLPADGARLQEARDAVRAAYDYLSERGSATSDEITAEVYPEFEASSQFDEDADEWFDRYVRPGFEQLPGVRRSGDEWRI